MFFFPHEVLERQQVLSGLVGLVAAVPGRAGLG